MPGLVAHGGPVTCTPAPGGHTSHLAPGGFQRLDPLGAVQEGPWEGLQPSIHAQGGTEAARSDREETQWSSTRSGDSHQQFPFRFFFVF